MIKYLSIVCLTKHVLYWFSVNFQKIFQYDVKNLVLVFIIFIKFSNIVMQISLDTPFCYEYKKEKNKI